MGALEVFSTAEKRNMIKYIGGIMLYKFALETLNGCMSSIVLKRTNPELGPNKMWTIMLSINYACQCFGSLLVAPLVKRFKTSVVLSRAIVAFALIVLVVPILELATGGGRQSGLGDENNYSPGNWNPLVLFAIYPVTGIFYGMVELIRRMIPTDIVGSDEVKLKKMDSLVHIFYEVAGTTGALLSSYWIAYFNYGYSLAIIPIMFTLSALVWTNISLGGGGDGDDDDDKPAGLETLAERPSIVAELKEIVSAFFFSVYLGAKLVVGRRSLVWLVFAYSLPLVLHRYLENVVFAQYAAQGLGVPSNQQKLVAGSNLGELIGALFVFLFSKAVATPLPWLRLDAITLAVVWIFPLVDPLKLSISVDAWVWCLFPIMLLVSFGWAAGDCSLVAFVQSHLANMPNRDKRTSALGSVMAFLYILYIVLFAVVAPVMGSVLDSFLVPITQKFGKKSPIEVRLPVVREAMLYTAGVFMTCCGVVILAATFIPRGALAFNPKIIGVDDGPVPGDDVESPVVDDVDEFSKEKKEALASPTEEARS